jgi:hypothetical protein
MHHGLAQITEASGNSISHGKHSGRRRFHARTYAACHEQIGTCLRRGPPAFVPPEEKIMLQLTILNLVCSQGARDAAFMAWLLLRQGTAFARHAMATAVRRVGECQELQKLAQKSLRRA